MEEYTQMTLDDWMSLKDALKQDILSAKDKVNGLKKDFVRIGYRLRRIEDGKLYEKDGYKSIAEFAKAECRLTGSDITRFMQINERYSVGGYSEELRPEFLEYGQSKLAAMLALPESDLQMIEPAASRENIRELGRFNRTEPVAGAADDIRELLEKFYKDNPDVLNELFCEPDIESMEHMNRLIEIVNPGGNRSYKKGLFFLMMYEDKLVIKKFGTTPQQMNWEEFFGITRDIFKHVPTGPNMWKRYFEGDDQEETGDAEEIQEETAETEEEIPGQMEITKDMPECCPDSVYTEEKQEIAPAQNNKSEHAEPRETEEEIPEKPRVAGPQNEVGKAISAIEKDAFEQAVHQEEQQEPEKVAGEVIEEELKAQCYRKMKAAIDYIRRESYQEAYEATKELMECLKRMV